MKGNQNNPIAELTNAAVDRLITVAEVNDTNDDLNAEANLTFDGSTLAVTGDLTVSGNATISGTTTSIQTTNQVIKDALIELANGASTGADSGIIIERGSTGDNAAIIWDESRDEFVLGTTTATGASTGDLTVARGNISVAKIGAGTEQAQAEVHAIRDIAASPVHSSTAQAIFEDDNRPAVQLSGSANNIGMIQFGDNAAAAAGQIYYDHSTDKLRIDAGGSTDRMTVDANGDVTVARNLDVDGTANLDAVDVDGNMQVDGTITVGQNDAGFDVVLHGNTASANVTFDASADDLILNGAAGLIVPEGQLTLGSTAITSTAAELNLLDNVTGLVQADFTKLAAVDASASELNILNGKSFVDEDDMSSNSATAIASQQSIKAYVDAQVTAQDLDATTDSGTIAVDLDSQSLSIVGGEGIDTSGSGQTITIACEDSAANNKGAVIVAGGTGASVAYSSGTATVSVDASQAGITTIGSAGATTNIAAGDLTMYNAVNDGNPTISLGSSSAERLTITANYASGAQTLDSIEFATATAESGADKGKFVFDVDGTDMLTINDGGISIAASKAVEVNGTAILSDSAGTMTLSNIDAIDATTETTLEAAIDSLANLTEVGTLTQGTWNAGVIASQYLDTDTAHLSGVQTFTGAKTFAEDVIISGTTPRLTIGDAGAEDTMLVFDGNAADYRIGIQDSSDTLEIGKGTAHGTTPIIKIDSSTNCQIMHNSAVADGEYSGEVAMYEADEALQPGEVVYFKSNGKVAKAVATAAATARCVAMCVAPVNANSMGVFLLRGFARFNDNFPQMTVGGPIYTPEAETANAANNDNNNVPEQNAPDTDGDFVQVIGYAISADAVYFSPGDTVIEVA